MERRLLRSRGVRYGAGGSVYAKRDRERWLAERIFKGAATTAIGRGEDDPVYRHYQRLLDGGTKPNLAKLTIARQIAGIVLALWRTGEAYDPKKLEATQ